MSGKKRDSLGDMDSEAVRRLDQQIWELWVEPEIHRRRARGDLLTDFKLRAFQILFASPSDGGSTTVRLNDEVTARAKIRGRRPMRAGDAVYAHDIETIEEITLLDRESNCAHITGLDLDGKWMIRLDFRYNSKRALEHLDAASEFLHVAVISQQEGTWRPFLENLWVAAELVAKAELLITPTGPPEELQDHNKIKGKYMSWARLGNAPQSSSRALAEVAKLRYQARYLRKPLCFDPARADTLVAAVREALGRTRLVLTGEEPEPEG